MAFSDIRNSHIFWYQKLIFWYQKMIFWYQKLISDIRKSFPDIWNSALKSYLAFHKYAMWFCYSCYYETILRISSRYEIKFCCCPLKISSQSHYWRNHFKWGISYKDDRPTANFLYIYIKRKRFLWNGCYKKSRDCVSGKESTRDRGKKIQHHLRYENKPDDK